HVKREKEGERGRAYIHKQHSSLSLLRLHTQTHLRHQPPLFPPLFPFFISLLTTRLILLLLYIYNNSPRLNSPPPFLPFSQPSFFSLIPTLLHILFSFFIFFISFDFNLRFHSFQQQKKKKTKFVLFSLVAVDAGKN
ncbi:hypothetical protein S245_037365, partial [Arachis hypogaea]